MNENTDDTRTPQELREALAAKIPEAFASRKKPAWARSRKRGDTLLRNWAKKYSPIFAERAKPIIYHKQIEDIPFDVLASIAQMEPGFWWWSENVKDSYYMMVVYLRGMLLAPHEMDLAFSVWLDHLIPLSIPSEIRVNYQLTVVDMLTLRDRLTSRSKQLENYTPEERAFIAEFFRNFAAMFPHEMLSEHKDTLAIAENFWDGVYWKQNAPEDEG